MARNKTLLKANTAKQDEFYTTYDALLEKYKDDGNADLESNKVLSLPEFEKYGGAVKIILSFGGKKNYEDTIKKVKEKIYS